MFRDLTEFLWMDFLCEKDGGSGKGSGHGLSGTGPLGTVARALAVRDLAESCPQAAWSQEAGQDSLDLASSAK